MTPYEEYMIKSLKDLINECRFKINMNIDVFHKIIEFKEYKLSRFDIFGFYIYLNDFYYNTIYWEEYDRITGNT